MFDGMEDADLIKMARGEVPPHMRAQLLQVMHGRVKKYAEGGLVKSDFSWITPQVAAQLLNRQPGTELPPGLSDDVLRQIVTKQNQRGKSALTRASETVGQAVSAPFQPDQADIAESDRADRLRELRNQGKPEPKKAAEPQSVISRAAAESAKSAEPTTGGDFEGKPFGKFPASAPAPKPPQSRLAQAARAQQPRASAPEPEQAFRLPTMRPEGEAEQAPTPKPEQQSTLARAAAEPGKKEPPTWASPLMAAGFAMLASRSPNFGNALGEAGLAFMSQSQQEEAQRRRALREATQDSREDRRLGQTDRQIDQQAELTREQIAARKAAAEENARLRGDEILMRREDREAQRGIQGARLAMDREMMDLEKQKMQAAIAQMGAKADPTRLIYDAANEIVAKSGGMISGPDAARAAMEMYRTVITGGAPAPGSNPLGFGGGALSQGGQTPNPARLLP